MTNARDLILELMDRDELTQADIARHIGRSPDMVRLIRIGKRPGNNLVHALQALHDKGTVEVSDLPPRRRRKDGKLAAVRGSMKGWEPPETKEGGEAPRRPTVIPDDPTDKSRARTRRNRFSEQHINLQGGVRKHEFHTPKRFDKKGRERKDVKGVQQMDDAVRRFVRRVSQSQAAKNRINPETGKPRGNKVLKFRATFADGRTTEIYGKGGRTASSVLKAIKKAGSVQEWIENEAREKTPQQSVRGSEPPVGQPLVKVEATEFYQSDQEGGSRAHRKRSIND